MYLEYGDLNLLLQRAKAFVDAAQCHGFICGQICTNELPDHNVWKEFLDLQEDDSLIVDKCYDEIYRLINIINTEIQSEDYDFELLLPGDDVDLTERVNALANWCDGFLTGFGITENQSNAVLTENCNEILGDFSKIAQVFVDEDEAESGEHALFELIEYVRMGTIVIYEEVRPANFTEQEPRVLH